LKALLSFKRIAAAALATALLIAASGCAPPAEPAPSPVLVEALPEPIIIETQPPTPSPSPTPEPEMLIDEDGDITLRADIAAQFHTAVFAFDHKPVVLIYHTHATESYLLTSDADYVETERGRTDDTRYNIIAVGEALKAALEERGYSVIHDTTNVEGDEILSAYSRSLQVMQQYDGIDLYIDLHRNVGNPRGRSENTILIDGVPFAKLFFVVGTGIGTYEGEYDAVPDWKHNYTLAHSLTEVIFAEQPNLVKPIRLKVGRYNQHMGLCLLAEIGTNADTFQAAMNTVPYLADAIAAVCPFTIGS